MNESGIVGQQAVQQDPSYSLANGLATAISDRRLYPLPATVHDRNNYSLQNQIHKSTARFIKPVNVPSDLLMIDER